MKNQILLSRLAKISKLHENLHNINLGAVQDLVQSNNTVKNVIGDAETFVKEITRDRKAYKDLMSQAEKLEADIENNIEKYSRAIKVIEKAYNEGSQALIDINQKSKDLGIDIMTIEGVREHGKLEDIVERLPTVSQINNMP